MKDIVLVGLTVVFFVVCLLYVKACDRI